MVHKVDERHLHALLGSVGKSIAAMPGAKRVVERMRMAHSPEDLAVLLQSVDIHMGEQARNLVWEAAMDRDRWREVHAALLRSAELQLEERFNSNA